jgi:hypothetical protein
MSTWKTKSGEVLNISEMSNMHLINSITFLNKRISEISSMTCRSIGYDAEDAILDYYSFEADKEFSLKELDLKLGQLKKEIKSRY